MVLQHVHDGRRGIRIVTGHDQGAPIRASGREQVGFEFVIADVVQRLHHARLGEVIGNDLATRAGIGLELIQSTVDRRPIVHGVDDDLAGQHFRRDGAELVERHGDDDDIGGLHGIRCGHGMRPGNHDVHEQLDVFGGSGRGNVHVVAGLQCGAADCGPHPACAEDADCCHREISSFG